MATATSDQMVSLRRVWTRTPHGPALPQKGVEFRLLLFTQAPWTFASLLQPYELASKKSCAVRPEQILFARLP